VTNQPSGLVCWKCGAALTDIPFPFGRIAVCPACDADLHVCKLCEFYDTSVSNQCREPIADAVKEKERANFCDYFQARPNAHIAQDHGRSAQARAQLEALFGDTPDKTTHDEVSLSPEDIAREQLEDLFRK